MVRDTDKYRPIEDYGVIGDLGSAALIAPDGSIDWCCWPRFDSPALFFQLLDADDGGYFRVGPSGEFESSRKYIDGTNVLQTTFRTDSGRVRLTDFMPLTAGVDADGSYQLRADTRCLIRRVEGLEGTVDLEIELCPCFDWGCTVPTASSHPWGICAEADDEYLALVAPGTFEKSGDNEYASHLTVEAGDEQWISLQYPPGKQTSPAFTGRQAPRDALEDTIAYWHRWIDRCAYEGPYADLVLRSVLALKLLYHAPSGSFVAAPTTSLPEEVGGMRNWDYRYVWLRDAGMILRSLDWLCSYDEALTFLDWLEDVWIGPSDDLQNLYTVDGSTELPERTVDHLEGYANSRPVRVGNRAAHQLQLDRIGHIFEAAYACEIDVRELDPELAPVLRYLLERAEENWKKPDYGIWEISPHRHHYTHSKLGCWVAFDRALRLADRGWLRGDTDRWRQIRRELRVVIEQRGYNHDLGAFTQTLDGNHLDAATLTIPLVGFLPADDPRVQSTIDRVRERLEVDGLVRRYRISDGLPGQEGAFIMCSFWLASALAESERLDEAHEVFEQIVAQTNDLGLLSEEIDLDDLHLLGNFPQGFSHLGLIETALRLERADAGEDPRLDPETGARISSPFRDQLGD